MIGQVNVSVANLYADGSYHSEVISQVILGESLEIQDTDGDFSLVQSPDGYSGWISNFQWVAKSADAVKKVFLGSHFIDIYSKPEISSSRLRDAVVGTQLELVDEKPEWANVKLPDGQLGWIEQKDLGSMFEKSRSNITDIACEFLGYPYYWGGKTPRGFDCSGLVQLVFSLTGFRMRRDSWMQHHDTILIGEEPAKAQPGDLYFFAENKKKISHVGIALGESKILHARGFVRINSLNPGDELFDQTLYDTFVDIRTIFD